MKKKMICLIIVITLAGISTLSAQMSKVQLQEMYVTYLRGQGYNPSVDSDGDVNFTAQSQSFYIEVLEREPQSFRIVLSGTLDPGSNRLRALEAASAATRTNRVVRVFLTARGRIGIDTYIFIARPEDFNVHLNRMVGQMVMARDEFLAAIR